MVLLLLSLACRSPAPPPDAPANPCPTQDRFIAEARVQASPVDWAVARLREHDVLALGEFHGLAPQIQLVSDVLIAASAAGLDVDLGAELLPAGRQAQLDAMTSAETWDEARWPEVVAGRPLLGPLALADYLGPVKAVWSASRSRPSRVVGLSPACDFASVADADAAVHCLADREAFMASRAGEEILARGRKLLFSAGFHHVSRQASPDGDGSSPTALARLSEGHTSVAVLLAGPVFQRADGAWNRACDGLFDAVGAAHGGSAYAADLRQPPWDGLSLSCLGEGGGALHEAFDAVIWLGEPSAAPPPSALPAAFFEAVGKPALTQWNRFEVELQGAPAGHLSQGADVWAGTAQSEAARYAALPYAATPACALK